MIKKKEKYVEGVMNYTGAKFKLLEQILPEFDYTKPYFIDLFSGGGSVYANILDKYDKIIVNDIIKDLVGIHEGLMNSDDIIELTKNVCPSKEDSLAFGKLREDYNDNPEPYKLWALMLSSTNNMMRFNKKFKYNQTWGKRSYNPNTEKKVIAYKEHIRQYKDKVRYISKSFNEIKIYKNTLYYIDPPYGYVKRSDGEIGKKQISEAGYNSFYYQKDDIDLYNYCHEINKAGSSFVISGVLEHGGETSWLLSKLISDGFNYKELVFNYEKVSKSSSNKRTKEIIIKNF